MEVQVEIYRDKMLLSTEGSSTTVIPKSTYSTTRLLVGTFMPAVECLKEGLAKVEAIGLLKPKPVLKLIAKEMNEDGLSEVEERCLQELGHASGAKKVILV